jgi:hypothetical protein
MTEFDKLMESAWQTARPPADAAALAASVHRTRWHQRLRRCLEIVLTLVGIALLTRPLFGGATTPAYWLVMPFFVAYLPTVWWLLLRQTQPSPADAAQNVSSYAHTRLTQLRAGLRDLRIARVAAFVLLAYASVAAISAFVAGDPAWQAPARNLLACAGFCVLGTLWLSRWQGRGRLREYRAMRRLT